MTSARTLWVGVGLLAACSTPPEPDQSSPQPEPVAQVRVRDVARKSFSEDLTVYGDVTSSPAGRQTLSVPYESHILRILVRPGQQLDGHLPIIELEPSPDTRLKVEQARAAVESAHETFDAVKQQFKVQLATNQQFEQAEQAARAAELELHSLTHRGSTRTRKLSTASSAVIASIHVTEGAIVPAGDPLVDLDLSDHREVRFGIEVEDVGRIEPASTMEVSDLALPPMATVQATVRALSDSLDPDTRMVDLFATLPTDAPFMLGQSVTGTVSIRSASALVVPRAALLPIDDRIVVFTVVDARAVSHDVRVGLETGDEVELVSGDVREGEQVVVEGVPALRDQMKVQIQESP